MTKIKEVDDSAMSISRKKKGRGFAYYNEDGTKIINKKILNRLRKLIIPPMWNDVFICGFDDGHIQAIGRDLKGRKQYIYHSIFEKQKQEEKFKKMLSFAEKLPKIRKRAYKDLSLNVWKKRKLLALITLILDEYGIRIGNKQYRIQNETFGLTTLRRKHLSIEDDEVIFKFKGKSKQEREVHIDDPELIPFIKKAADMPGYEIFRYKDDHGSFKEIDSDDVNKYISTNMGEDFSSKDFRTWAASRLAIECYDEAIKQKIDASRKKFSNIVIKMVASELGNTPSVCKNYYVHPAIFNAIDKKEIPTKNPYTKTKSNYTLTASEKLAVDIIEDSYVN
ncbi:DNA topoisomerase IB [Cellulophaga sp. HaHaR_3_176]|uniref:DNA topoisomerase IB n=1 Tax=Cellulophaga sp. HaHaR_3_176 TaxID=1942464 RepID=UPI0020B10F09|nr:DNA topoisomerase IB [Cellulophaga sp. HaHaR_3_176]